MGYWDWWLLEKSSAMAIFIVKNMDLVIGGTSYYLKQDAYAYDANIGSYGGYTVPAF